MSIIGMKTVRINPSTGQEEILIVTEVFKKPRKIIFGGEKRKKIKERMRWHRKETKP